MYNTKHLFLVAFLVALGCHCAKIAELKSADQMGQIYEANSNKPIIQLYYQRSYLKAGEEGPNLVSVLNEAAQRCSERAVFIMCDCDDPTFSPQRYCKYIKSNKITHTIIGIYPSGLFYDIGGAVAHTLPNNNIYQKSPKFPYQVESFISFVDQISANFFQRISNERSWKLFMRDRHCPKLIYVSSTDQVPTLLKTASVLYFLKFQFAHVTPEAIKRWSSGPFDSVTSPSLFVLSYDYLRHEWQPHLFQSKNFNYKNSVELNTFLNQYALMKPRLDYLAERMNRMSIKGEIIRAQNNLDIERIVDESPTATFVAIGHLAYQKTLELQKKYKQLATYTYLELNIEDIPTTVQLYMGSPNGHHSVNINPESLQVPFPVDNPTKVWRTMLLSLDDDKLGILVTEKYSHLCLMTGWAILREFSICKVMTFPDLMKVISSESEKGEQYPDIGIIFSRIYENSTHYLSSKTFDSEQPTYLGQIIPQFVSSKIINYVQRLTQRPIYTIDRSRSLLSQCYDWKKHCAIVFSPDSNFVESPILANDVQPYLNDYLFISVDSSCNAELMKAFGIDTPSMVLFDAANSSYLKMKGKLTHSSIVKFLSLVKELEGNHKLKFTKMENITLAINHCHNNNNQTPKGFDLSVLDGEEENIALGQSETKEAKQGQGQHDSTDAPGKGKLIDQEL